MLLFSGAVLFEAAASSAVEPTQDTPEFVTPWPAWFAAPPPLPSAAEPPGIEPAAHGAAQPLPGGWSFADALAAVPEPPAAAPLVAPPPPPSSFAGPAPIAPPGESLPIEALLAALAGTPRPTPPSAPAGAPPPASGDLDFPTLLALLFAPAADPPQPVGEIPAPFLPPAPIAEEPSGLRDWSLL